MMPMEAFSLERTMPAERQTRETIETGILCALFPGVHCQTMFMTKKKDDYLYGENQEIL
jgi:hypothetical protein